jgi:hypothetical protein
MGKNEETAKLLPAGSRDVLVHGVKLSGTVKGLQPIRRQ